MAHVKWYGCLLMAVCLFAMIESLQSNNPPRRIEKREEHLLEGPEDSLELVGANATFICVSSLRSCLNMTWYIQAYVYWMWAQTDFTPINHLDMSVRDKIIVQNTTFGCKLTFMNVQSFDNGRIFCQIYAGGRYMEGRRAEIIVSTQRYALRGIVDNSSIVGEDVVFNCISSLSATCVGISWYKFNREGDRAVIFSAQEGNFLRNKYVLANFTWGCQLTIRNTDLTDNGRYMCKIVISRIPLERSANLLVIVPLNRPENLMSFFRWGATFSCASPLRSCVNMTWYQDITSFFGSYFLQLRTFNTDIDGKYLVENTTVGCQMTIRNINRDDAGSYKCKLRIGDRLFEGSISSLKVTTQEDALLSLSDFLGTRNGWNILTCLSPLGDCRGMSWYKETPGTGRVAVFSEANGIYPNRRKYMVNNSTWGCHLYIKNLELSDTGFYHCQIQVSGRAIERSATMIIFRTKIENQMRGPDDSVNFINTTAVLTCTSPLRSCAIMNWYKYIPSPSGTEMIMLTNPNFHLRDRYVLENTTMGCRLIIGSVQLNDTGSYTCEIVVKSTSFKGRTAQLSVMGRPTPPPTEQENAFLELSDNFTTPGNGASFTCVSRLKNCIGINWYTGSSRNDRRTIFRDQKVLFDKYIVTNSTSGCELIIKRVEYEDRGFMFCERVTSQRSYEVTATLHVFETKSEKVESRFDWQSAFFTCDSPLRSCANMTWYKDLNPKSYPPRFVPVNDADSTVRGRWTVQNSSSGCQLKVIDVQLNDTGDVYCEIMLGGRPIRGERTSLVVFGDEKK